MLTADDIAALAGRRLKEEQVETALSVVTAMVKSYCRASWAANEIPADVVAVIQTATLRLLMNPTGLQAEAMGGLSVTYSSQEFGLTVLERIVLDRFRVKAR